MEIKRQNDFILFRAKYGTRFSSVPELVGTDYEDCKVLVRSGIFLDIEGTLGFFFLPAAQEKKFRDIRFKANTELFTERRDILPVFSQGLPPIAFKGDGNVDAIFTEGWLSIIPKRGYRITGEPVAKTSQGDFVSLWRRPWGVIIPPPRTSLAYTVYAGASRVRGQSLPRRD